MPPFAAGLLVFATSAAVLVIEILAARLLAPYVGNTLETYTAIIGTVLAGISLGAWVGGRLADRSDPRRLLGPAIALGGALALTTVPIVRLIGPALPAGGAVTSVILAFLGFFAPATVLSAVPPMVVKIQLGSLTETGSVVGRLSAISTAGGIIGTFVTGFVLVAAFPTPPVLLAVGGTLLLAGAGLMLAMRGSRRDQPIAAVLVLGLIGGGATTLTPSPCDVETAYHCASVIEQLPPCTGLTLYLDTLRHSCVHPEDPTRLDFSYAQILSDVIGGIAPGGAPVDALHIGGGGFSLPGYLAAAHPGSRSLVLELDASLVDIAEQRLGLRTGPELQVDVGDARTGLAGQPQDAYDLVIGDAFGGLAVPWHLTTREVAEDIQRTLRPGGTYAVNVIDYPPLAFARAEAATLREVFADVVVIAPSSRIDGAEGGNFVMVASDQPLPVQAIAANNALRGDDDVIAGGAQLDAFIGDARPLTDDFAPVDQLLTPR
jgi:spermidine synthase